MHRTARTPLDNVDRMLEPSSLGMISGATLLGAAGLRAAWGVRTVVRREGEVSDEVDRRRAAFANQLEAALHYARASKPSLRAWTGTRSFRVSAVVDEAESCRSYYLVPEDGRPLPRFEPGQYLTFHLPSADPMRPLVRCYSLSERPREDFYRVTVKRVSANRHRPESPAGQGSGYFHQQVQPGALLAVEAPQGAFFLDPTDDSPVVLIGGGIGVTPIMSMVSAIVHRRDPRPAFVFAGFRSGREHPFRVRLAEMATAASNVRLDVCYSQPAASDRPGVDFTHRGRIDVVRLRQSLPSNNFRYYLCGPAGMMESLVPALLDWGVPAADIHYEAFGPASVRGMTGVGVGVAPCEVQFARSGRSLRWSGEERSLLEVAEQGGVPLESGCRAGNCGQCRMMVAAGRVVHVKPPGVELIDSECLACIARPDGDVILDA
jgi:ferredoxin-NADP reductase